MLGGLAATLLAACGGGAPGHYQVGGSETLPRFLQPWAAFPIDASPRPIVLIIGPILDPLGGFRDGQSKEAYMGGLFNRPQQLPTGPASSQGYPVISADSAVALLQSPSHSQTPPAIASTAATRLTITSARFGEGSFLTDRGWKSMPAWLFSLAGVDGVVSVLAVAPFAQWLPSGWSLVGHPGRPDIGARIADDHRTLILGFTGAQSEKGPCGESYTLKLTESATAVLVTVIRHHNDSGTVACTLVGYPRSASAVLGAPLGHRVVIEGFDGGVIAATGNP
jgi:hypothetical protein